VTGAAWRAATRIKAGVGDRVKRTGDSQAQVRYSVAERLRGRVTLCAVCTVHKGTRSAGFLVWPQIQGRRFLPAWPQTGGFGFLGLGLKPDSYGLMIWAVKSPWWFFGLGLKTKWAMIYRLCHKPDKRMKIARDTRRDLVACFAWKQVGLEFLSLASRLAEARRGWYMWHHHGGHMKIKLKTDGSMRWAASDSSTTNFVVFIVLVHKGNLVF
jgi:hypothetical protein